MCAVVEAMRSLAVIGVCAVLGSACGGFTDTSHLEGYCFNPGTGRYELCQADAEVDAGVLPDAAAEDASPADVGWADAEVSPDATVEDAGPIDMGLVDSGGHPDAAPVDMGLPDTGVWADAAPMDVGFPDSGVHPDAMPVDVGALDSGVWPDAAPVDVGFPDSGVHPDAATPDSGPTDAGGPAMVTITINISGNGMGVVTSAPGFQIDCRYDGQATSGSCVGTFPVTEMVTLTATADRFYSFNGWTNACASTSQRFCSLDLTLGNQTITAFFN